MIPVSFLDFARFLLFLAGGTRAEHSNMPKAHEFTKGWPRVSKTGEYRHADGHFAQMQPKINLSHKYCMQQLYEMHFKTIFSRNVWHKTTFVHES